MRVDAAACCLESSEQQLTTCATCWLYRRPERSEAQLYTSWLPMWFCTTHLRGRERQFNMSPLSTRHTPTTRRQFYENRPWFTMSTTYSLFCRFVICLIMLSLYLLVSIASDICLWWVQKYSAYCLILFGFRCCRIFVCCLWTVLFWVCLNVFWYSVEMH